MWYQSFAGKSIHLKTLLLAADCTGASVVAVPACRYAPVSVGSALPESHEVCHGYRDSVGFIKRVSVWQAFRGARGGHSAARSATPVADLSRCVLPPAALPPLWRCNRCDGALRGLARRCLCGQQRRHALLELSGGRRRRRSLRAPGTPMSRSAVSLVADRGQLLAVPEACCATPAFGRRDEPSLDRAWASRSRRPLERPL